MINVCNSRTMYLELVADWPVATQWLETQERSETEGVRKGQARGSSLRGAESGEQDCRRYLLLLLWVAATL